METNLEGKIALVTGSTAGIGKAIATGLAKEGATVILNGRTEARIDATKAEILQLIPHADIRGIVADFADVAAIDGLIADLPEVDILVNNVGIFEPKAFSDISDADWYKIFDINVMSGIRLSRHYLPKMLEKNWGRIIFLSSESAVQIPAEMIHYGMTKTAQIAVAGGLARMTKGTGVTVNSVLPGPTKSEGAEKFLNAMALSNDISVEDVEKDFFEKDRPSSLLKRFASTEEVANLVVYLSSTLSSATNGASLRVDGGTLPTIL